MSGDFVGMTESEINGMEITASGHASCTGSGRIVREMLNLEGGAWELVGCFGG